MAGHAALPRKRLPMSVGGIAAAALAVSLCTATADAQIPASTYGTRRAAALARLGGDILIVPARASFLEADQRGFIQAPDFQYLTGLDNRVGSVLVLDGGKSSAVLFLAPVSRRTPQNAAADAATARSLGFTDVMPVAALESWLRRRFGARQATVDVASMDLRGAVESPPPMARSIVRWDAWLTGLGAGHVQPGAAILSPLREIKEGGWRAARAAAAPATRRSRPSAPSRPTDGNTTPNSRLSTPAGPRARAACHSGRGRSVARMPPLRRCGDLFGGLRPSRSPDEARRAGPD